MTPQYDIVIVGAGIVGLAAAHKYLSKHPGKRLLVIEKEDRIAAHQTDIGRRKTVAPKPNAHPRSARSL